MLSWRCMSCISKQFKFKVGSTAAATLPATILLAWLHVGWQGDAELAFQKVLFNWRKGEP